MIRVLIVDDSPTMRAIIRRALVGDHEIDVIGEAGDAHEARSEIKRLEPDVITLDINMPGMSGLEFLDRLMRLHPMPAVVLSSAGKDVAENALQRGGVEFIPKPSMANGGLEGLAAALKRAASSHIGQISAAKKTFRPGDYFVAIGASTGGVEALVSLLKGFPSNCPPTVITQHMPAGFTSSFADRLNRTCAPEVSEAETGSPLKVGSIYIAPGGGRHLEITGRASLRCRLVEGALVSGHRPSVDVLFGSAARYGSRGVGAILTGMGRDGAEGLLKMRQAGAMTIGQDEKTSLVYGMPRAAREIGAVTSALPLPEISAALLAACSDKK